MKSYTQMRNQAGIWTKNTASANLSYLDGIANDDYRHLCALKDWPFLEQLRTILTIGNQQFYPLLYDTDMVREISVTISTTTYTPKLSPSREHWDMLNLTAFTSDIPEWYFVFAGTVGLWPKPASSDNTINITQKCRVIDLQFPDFTTGSIDSVVNGSTLITATTGTIFTAGMVGRYIQITPSNAVNTGDGFYYLITGVPTSTTLTLARAYGGTTITAGAACPFIIGQFPLLPETFHDTPWKQAAFNYWSKESDKRAMSFKTDHASDIVDLIRTWSAPTTDLVIDDGRDPQIINPNLVIRL